MSESYHVTWSVPENDANEFVQHRKSKKDEFSNQADKGQGTAQRVEQKVEAHGGPKMRGQSMGEGGGRTFDREFEDIGGSGPSAKGHVSSDQDKF